MDKPYVEDFFVANRWILQCAGLWAPKSNQKLICITYKIYSIITLLIFNIYFTSTEFISLYFTFDNEYDLIKNISFALTHLMGVLKAIFFYSQGHRLLDIIGILESKEFCYENCSEKQFYPGLISKKYKNTGIKYTILFFILAHVTLISSYLPPVISTLRLINNQPFTAEMEINTYKLPYYSWVPFKYNTPLSFLVALGYQAIPMFSFAYSIVGMDTLFMNIMNCIGCNLNIIQEAFLTIRNRAVKHTTGPVYSFDKLYDSEELKLRLGNDMKKICRHLQAVFKACGDLEYCHKYLTLTQITATLFILCSCLYLVSSTPINNKQFYCEIIYMVAMCFQLVLYCWFGNEVTLKASKLPLVIWQCDWLTMDDDFKKSMILTMTRAKKPLYLTAGNFAPLTLSTFVSIVKASYSFFTVIKGTSE